jgi:hypothetical protein
MIFFVGISAGFLVYILAQKARLPVRFGLSIVTFSAVSAILTFLMQQMTAR